jgi:ribose transport system substrate-binding protein
MKKTIALIILIVTLLTSFTACSTSAPKSSDQPFIEGSSSGTVTPQNAPQNKRTIALVMKTLTNPFFEEMEKGARKAEKELGITLLVKTAAQETSIEQQIEIVEELIHDKVDAIVIAPGDSKELIPVLRKAQAAGIKVVNIDNRLDADLSKQAGLVNVPFISVDNEKGAYQAAKVISDKTKSPAEAVILEGIREAKNAQDRKAGAQRAFGENSNIKVVDSETAHWKIDEAHDVISAIYEQHPDVKLIFCANDMMALGVIKYLDETKKADVLVAGYDALDQAKQAIKDGKMVATIDQQAALQGYTGITYANKLLNGQTVPLETMVDVLVVTATQP